MRLSNKSERRQQRRRRCLRRCRRRRRCRHRRSCNSEKMHPKSIHLQNVPSVPSK